MKRILSILFAVTVAVSMGAVTGPTMAAELSSFDFATIINVPDDYETIQEAVDAAGPGDAIMVAAGEYGGFQVLEKSDITIIGAEEATVTGANITSVNRGEIGEAWSMAAVKDSQNIHIAGIDFDGAGITGEDAVVGIAYVDSTGDIRDLTVENMVGSNVGVGIAIIGTGTVGVTGAGITGNMVGLYFFENPVAEANYNTIEDNTLFGALNQGTAPVSALYNYWGSEWGPFHPEDNTTGTGNPVSDNVDFRPWASGPRLVETLVGAGEHNVDAKAEADTVVRIDVQDPASGLVQSTNDDGDASIETFSSINALSDSPDPDATPPSFWQPLNKYIQVGVKSTGQVSSVRIELYYGSDLATQAQQFYRLLWLDEDAGQWKQVEGGESGVIRFDEPDSDGYYGYMYVVVTGETTPDVSYLNDGEWGGYGGPTEVGGLCAIATAAYGTDTAQELNILREFRDNVLLPNNLGSEFVSLYYRTSPTIADFISRHDGLRTAVRIGFVDPVVRILNWSHGLWS